MIFKFLSTLVISVFTTTALASVGTGHTFMCNIVGFDTKNATLACDPNKPKERMKTPRAWMDADAKLKSGAIAKFALNDQQFEEWLVMNNSPLAKTNEKSR